MEVVVLAVFGEVFPGCVGARPDSDAVVDEAAVEWKDWAVVKE